MATIQVHPLSGNPTEAWESMAKTQIVRKLKPMPRDSPIEANKVRFVCISDTHSLHSRIPDPIPDGDVLLHGGDFTRCGLPKDIQDFDEFLGRLPHKHKIVIGGNHELSFDRRLNHTQVGRFPFLGNPKESLTEALKSEKSNDLLTNATYLEDSEIVINGIKIYGTPWQPKFCNWAFNLNRGAECLQKWNLIPDDTDILLSHGPPLGHGDWCCSGVRAGCCELLSTVQQRVKPKFHVFGHIHEGYGITTDDHTVYINCSICTINYKPWNPPVIFDYILPEGHTKN